MAAFKVWNARSKPRVAPMIYWEGPLRAKDPEIDLDCLLKRCTPAQKSDLEAKAAALGLVACHNAGTKLVLEGQAVPLRTTDRAVEVKTAGAITPGDGGSYSFTVSLPAYRNDSDKDGRKFTIVVSAADNAGNEASKSLVVTVPHNQGKK